MPVGTARLPRVCRFVITHHEHGITVLLLMATIVFNWELGAALGHIGRFLPIALELRARGHRPVLVLRDLTQAEAVLGPHRIEYLQAPIWLSPVSGLPPEMNFTETLFRFGFLHREGLLSMARAWRSLWKLLRPGLLVFDHSPTALLAARGAGLPRLIVGNSFAVPPRVRPLPAYRWWVSISVAEHARLVETDERLTRNCNAVLTQLGSPPMSRAADLFEVEARCICGRASLDVYGGRADGDYVGPINTLHTGIAPAWPKGEDPAVFAYLKTDYRHLEPLLAAMSRNRGRYLVYAAGLPEQTRKRYESEKVAFSTAPLRMNEVAQYCQAIICHAGGMTDIAVEHGKPVLLLPTQMEQTMTSHRIADLGAGVFLPIDSSPAALGKLIKRLLEDTSLARCATAYAAHLPSTDQQASVRRVVATCEALLAEADQTNAGSGEE